MPYIVHNSHKTVLLLQIASKPAARYIDDFYKAAQNIQIPTKPSTLYRLYFTCLSFLLFYLYFIFLYLILSLLWNVNENSSF